MKYADSKRAWRNYRNGKNGHEIEHRELLPFERKTIVNTIMICLVNKVYTLRPNDYIFIFSSIQYIFPMEMMGCYYMPAYSYYEKEGRLVDKGKKLGSSPVGKCERKRKRAQKNSEKASDANIKELENKNPKIQVVAKGQLRTAWLYRNEKYKAEKKLLEETLNESEMATKAKVSATIIDPSFALLEMKEWLSENYEPWAMVLEKWEKTCPLRAVDIKTIEEFDLLISEWPRFTRKVAYTLVELDFIYAYPGKNHFKSLWPKYRQIIVNNGLKSADKKPEKDRKKNADIIKRMNRFAGMTDEEGNLQGFTALLALYFLLPNKNKNTTQNLDAILHKAEKGQKVDDIMRDLSEKQKESGRFHPIIIFYEDQESLPYKFYTCVNDLKYEFENITTAIDVLFKIFFVFNLEYPEECKNVLTFLQQFFYDIFLCEDIKSVNALSVMIGINAARARECNRKILRREFDVKNV